jgi:hypothetical protein
MCSLGCGERRGYNVEHGWSQGVGPADGPWGSYWGLDRAQLAGRSKNCKRRAVFSFYIVICCNYFLLLMKRYAVLLCVREKTIHRSAALHAENVTPIKVYSILLEFLIWQKGKAQEEEPSLLAGSNS